MTRRPMAVPQHPLPREVSERIVRMIDPLLIELDKAGDIVDPERTFNQRIVFVREFSQTVKRLMDLRYALTGSSYPR